MFFIKQAATYNTKLGPFVNKTDGVAYETGMSVAMGHASTGVLLSKNGAAFADRAETTDPAYDAFGYYLVKLDATDTNTVGTLKVIFGDAAVCLPCEANYQVLEPAVYDALFADAATAVLPDTAGVTELLTRIPDATAGEAGGVFIAGTNAALTVTGAVTLSDTLTVAKGVAITNSTAGGAGLSVTGNTTGAGILATGGNAAPGISAVGIGAGGHGIRAISGTTAATAGIYAAGGATNATNGMRIVGGSTSGVGLVVEATDGAGATVTAGTSGTGLSVTGAGNGQGLFGQGAGTGSGITGAGAVGGTGHGLYAVSGTGATGDGINASATSTAGHGMKLTGTTSGAGLSALGGNVGPGALLTGGGDNANGDGLRTVAGGSLALDIDSGIISDIHDAIHSIAVAGTALNAVAAGTTLLITGGTDGGTVYTATQLGDATYYTITATAGGTIDVELLFTLPNVVAVPVSVTTTGYLRESAPAAGVTIDLYAWNYVTGPAFELVHSNILTGITTAGPDQDHVTSLLARHRDTANGNMRLQFKTTTAEGITTSLNLNHVVVSYAEAVSANITAIKTKTDYLPAATAGTTNGVFIAGTNAATTITTALTTTFTGNLTGSVNSVTDPVTLANGAHGGAAATLTLKSVAVTNTDGGGTAVAFVANAAGGTGLLVSGVAKDIDADISGTITTVTGNVTGSVGSVAGAVNSVTSTVNADVKKINATTVNGDGSVGNPWGP